LRARWPRTTLVTRQSLAERNNSFRAWYLERRPASGTHPKSPRSTCKSRSTECGRERASVMCHRGAPRGAGRAGHRYSVPGTSPPVSGSRTYRTGELAVVIGPELDLLDSPP
jgi:hypothetical protein